jgi:tripartite-type tricarboxylate transporter receptor subunit TctC
MKAKTWLVGAALAVAGCAFAQGWPSAPVKLVVPYPPGSSGDLIARRLAPGLGNAIGGSVIVDNKPGANGNIAMQFVAAAPPDGHTFLVGSDIQFAVTPAFDQKLPFDVEKNFETVGPIANIDLVLMATTSLPAKDLREAVALAKQDPQRLNYGSTGIGSTHQLFVELMKLRGGFNVTHVPYSGTGAALPSLIKGDVHIMFLGVPQAIAQTQSGRLKPLAVGSPTPLSVLPGVPTISESGLPGFEANNLWALWAPAKTPQATVDKMRGALAATINDPAAKKWYADNGLRYPEGGVNALNARLQADRVKWREVIRASGISPQN